MSRTLTDWLARLENQHPVAIDLGLERVAQVAERLHLLAQPLAGRVVTVAGTNGKGSTVALLEALAAAHGLTTACYTSPHLTRYNERLRVDGQDADDATLVAAFERVEAARLQDEPVSLTYFEAGTLAALVVIAEKRPQMAILEVGLGGRLDAVNVVDSDLAIITTIAHDHADYLGDDLDGIAFEKAGILRHGRPAVLGSRELPPSVTKRLEALAAPAYWLGRAFDHRGAGSGDWQWWGQANEQDAYRFDSLPEPGLPPDNAAVAMQALALCDVTLRLGDVREALGSAKLAGRLQWVGNWCFDIAHNPHAAGYVATQLALRPRPPRRFGLLGVLKDKDAAALVEALSPAVDAWVAVGLGGARGRRGDDLATTLEACGAEIFAVADSPAAGVETLRGQLEAEDEVLVCGSFHTVGEALSALTALPASQPG